MARYNNALAFASFGANIKSLSSSGPQVISIGGKIYHNVLNICLNIVIGHDCAFIEISNIDLNLIDDNNSSNGKDNNQNDEYDYEEIKQYINTRYLCPPEAMHRLL